MCIMYSVIIFIIYTFNIDIKFNYVSLEPDKIFTMLCCVWKSEPIVAGGPHLARILDPQMKISTKQIARLKLGVFHRFILKCTVFCILLCSYHSINLLCPLSASPYFLPSNCFLVSTLGFRDYPKEQLEGALFYFKN